MSLEMKKIAIIGAGCSGLTAIKCCLDEGLEPHCFEKDHDIGGLWRFEAGEKNGGTVYGTTVINSSKETLAYSDFPIPKEFPNFMHHTKVMDYYNMYCDKFNLRKYIEFNSKVISCAQVGDFDESGRWEISVENSRSGEVKSSIFDGVMICIGHHAEPYYPVEEFSGQENFKGVKMHSRKYREPSCFTDKRVTVVGTGNSACDMAVELSRNAKKVCLSTRRGAWVFNRIADNGVPFDLVIITRFNSLLMNGIPTIINPVFESVLNRRFNHEKYGMKPKHRVLSQHPTINDELPNRIVNGTVIVKGNIDRFTEDEVVFDDGSKEKMDAVIFATGYSFHFSFLKGGVLDISKHESNLFRLVWPMNMKHNTLAVIGLVQPLGVIGPCSEIQARWAARVFSGSCKLPTQQAMKEEYGTMMSQMRNRYLNSHRHTLEVDGVEYMDSVAEAIDCKPDLLKLAFTDPLLAWQVYMGPFTCFQYRLRGPGKWKDARKTIMTQWDRVWYPMKRCSASDTDGYFRKVFIVVAVACVLLSLCFKLC